MEPLSGILFLFHVFVPKHSNGDAEIWNGVITNDLHTKGNKDWSRVGGQALADIICKIIFLYGKLALSVAYAPPPLQKIHVLAIDPVIFNFSFMHQFQILIKLFLFSGS